MTILTPNKLPLSWKIKEALGCVSKKPVMCQGKIITIGDLPLCNHDLYHLEVAQLERIQIGKHLVSGVHGINSQVLHESPIVAEYDGIWDEVRVAFHEFMLRTSIYNTLKLLAWMLWLTIRGISPIMIFWRHYISLKRFCIKGFYNNKRSGNQL